MKLLDSALENREEAFVNFSSYMNDHGFSLGGNWDYEHGYFDRSLDEGQKVWLRIPFQVTHGSFDGESSGSDAVIRIGQPFLLNDAPVEDAWLEKAESVLRETEQAYDL